MNPYAPHTPPSNAICPLNTYTWCFAIVAYLTYVSLMMVNRGAARVLEEYSQSSTGGAIEAGIILCVSAVGSWIVALKLYSQIPLMGIIASRMIGGLTFGIVFVTCQPYLFPHASGAIGSIVRTTPFESIGLLFDVIFLEQPYVLLPTIVFAVASAWAAERLFRSLWPQPKSTNKATELSRVS